VRLWRVLGTLVGWESFPRSTSSNMKNMYEAASIGDHHGKPEEVARAHSILQDTRAATLHVHAETSA